MSATEHESFEAEIAAETCRARAHAREAARHRGVAWSGCAPEPLAMRTREDLMGRARRTLAERAAWRETDAGRFLNALVAGQQIAGAAHQACERARAAWSRGFVSEAEACAAAVRELEIQALRLLRNARFARRLVRLDSSVEPPPRSRLQLTLANDLVQQVGQVENLIAGELARGGA